MRTKSEKVNKQCLNCRNYEKGICGGINKGKCNIADPIHSKKQEDWWQNDER